METEGEPLQEYEDFVKNRLCVNLQTLQAKRESLLQKIRDYDDFVASLQHIQSQNLTEFTAHAPLGCGVSVEAHVPNTSHVFVNVGLGVYVACSQAEAIEKVAFLKSCYTSQLDTIHSEIGELRASIEFMEAGIEALGKEHRPDPFWKTDSHNSP